VQTVPREYEVPFDCVNLFTFTIFGRNASCTQEFYFHATAVLIRSVGRGRRCEEEEPEEKTGGVGEGK